MAIQPKTINDLNKKQADEPSDIAADSLPIADGTDTFLSRCELPPPPVAASKDIEVLAHKLFASPTSTENDELPAVAGYEVLSVLGRGGMGIVYLAKQRGLNRLVALKMLQPKLVLEPLHAARFRTEVEAIARLQHPNIVQVFEVGEHEDRPYCALEYVAGGTLAQACGNNLPSPQAAAELLATVAEAVHYAHERGVLHRDLKPANILLQRTEDKERKTEDGGQRSEDREQKDGKTKADPSSILCSLSFDIPKIADFGLAKWLDDTATNAGVTEHGLIIGTPSYMAPEQVVGGSTAIGVTTDVYALGAILYELLTGRPPFKADSALETARQTQFEDPAAPSQLQPGLPCDLETICLQCLQKSPDRRYPSAQILADELKRFCAGEPIHARPTGKFERLSKWARRRPAVAALIAVVIAALTTSAVAGWAFAVREREHARIVTNERDAAERARSEKEQYLRESMESDEQLRHLTDQIFVSVGLSKIPKSLLTEIANVYRKEIERDTDNPDQSVRRLRAKNTTRLADTLRNLGKSDEAYYRIRQAVENFRQLVANDPLNDELRLELGICVNKLGQYIRKYDLKSAERRAEAIACQREAVQILSQLPPMLERHPQHSALGAALNNLGYALLQEKDPKHLPEIRLLFEKAIECQKTAHEIEPTNYTREFLRNHHGGLADTLIGMGDHAAAAEQIILMIKLAPNEVRVKQDAAGLFQRCARLAAADSRLSPDQRQQLSNAYADEARKVNPPAEPGRSK
jgi:serine/threonine protein kinase